MTVEDADAGTAAEQPVFDEPGADGAAAWRTARLRALFAGERPAVVAASLAAAHDAAVVVESIAAVDERDWVAATQAQFGPIEIDADFWIVPSWAAAPAGARAMRLDPGNAFGTGTHPTTRMALAWMVRAARRRAAPWPDMLDYGCGSGILAIGAAMCGTARVDAVDIDAAAVATTARNAAANGVCVRSGPVEIAGDGYALVVANILATPLVLLAPALAGKVAPGGTLVLSGILERQAASLAAAYAPWLELATADVDDGWVLLVGTKPRAMIDG